MKILVVEPMKPCEVREIPDTLEAMQALVGGYIQAVYPFQEEVAVICNEKGRNLDLPYSGFKRGVMDMGTDSEVFTFGDSEAEGNLSFREREGYAHDGRAANEYMYNALRFFWNAE